MSGEDFLMTADDIRLWYDPRRCPHSNENACASCDFDGYYLGKYGDACPWAHLT
jgi:hypothetical protein